MLPYNTFGQVIFVFIFFIIEGPESNKIVVFDHPLLFDSPANFRINPVL